MRVKLKVIGAGNLGKIIAKYWKSQFPNCTVVLKFRSKNQEREKLLRSEGFEVISQEVRESFSAPLVVFSAPPTGNQEYVANIKVKSKFSV